MKSLLAAVLIISAYLAGMHFYSHAKNNSPENLFADIIPADVYVKTLSAKAKKLSIYAAKNNYNTDIGFIIDMHIASGQNRFFIYDFKRDSVVGKGLVAHGRCNQRFLEGRKYDNTPGCGCSSLGKYKIGKSYYGSFGLAYKLYGLDPTNDNAFKRFLVLHSHECVPETSVYPDQICQSDGCPTVSPQMIKKLSKIIDASAKPILLFVFDEK